MSLVSTVPLCVDTHTACPTCATGFDHPPHALHTGLDALVICAEDNRRSLPLVQLVRKALMAYSAQPRNKDHWSMNIRVKRPGGVSAIALVVVVIQTILLAATASSLATGGGLYGCTSACGTAAEPATPPLAVALGVAMLVLPL